MAIIQILLNSVSRPTGICVLFYFKIPNFLQNELILSCGPGELWYSLIFLAENFPSETFPTKVSQSESFPTVKVSQVWNYPKFSIILLIVLFDV